MTAAADIDDELRAAIREEVRAELRQEIRAEIEDILTDSERSTLVIGSCLSELVEHAESFIEQIKTQLGEDHGGDSATSTLDDQCASVETFLSALRRAIDQQAEAAGKVLESSNQVTRAAGGVEKVAGETKMLCLNTMIEASRLEEVGKPFAVIAGQMRDLSQNIASSNQRITSISAKLQPLLDRVQRSVDSIHESTESFADEFETQRARIARVTAKLRDDNATTLEISDQKLAEILSLSNRSLESLQGQDIMSQRLRRVLRVLNRDEETLPKSAQVSHEVAEGLQTSGYLSESIQDGGSSLNPGDIALF